MKTHHLTTIIVATILALSAAACGSSGGDEGSDAANDAVDAGDESADTAAEEEASDGGAAHPALIDAAVCDLLDGSEVDGLGALALADTQAPTDTSRLCAYLAGGRGFRFSINVNGSSADADILRDFIETGGADELSGLGDVAILQEGQGVRSIFDDTVLVTVSAYGTGTTDSGAREVDLAASEAAARLLIPQLEPMVTG